MNSAMRYQTRQFTTRKAAAGFTLVELIITMAIGAIILTQAVPSFLSTIKNSHLTAETNKLVADINLARSEAIKRGKAVSICSTTNPNASPPTCAGSWGTGWAIMDADATLIRVGLGQSPGSSVIFTASDTTITFSSDGLLSDATAKDIIICDDRGTASRRQILVSATGRPRLDKTVGACS